MFVINPDIYSLPTYRIGPFRTRDVSINHCLPDSDLIDEYLDSRFRDANYIYTYNGRSSINIALTLLNPGVDSVVTILTTTGNYYISSCVTNEIEKFCKWSREFLPETRIILVNHEFGYPYPDLPALRKYNLPIIEDCAGSFFSVDRERHIGTIGDYVIYSFPKMFPLQIGGLLVSNNGDYNHTSENLTEELLRHIKNALSEYIVHKDQIIRRRIDNYCGLRDRFERLGLHERFDLIDGIVPGVYMFRTDNYSIDLPELKKHFWAHGIHSSVFYGENAFFIPVHQALTEPDLDYFFEVMKAFLEK